MYSYRLGIAALTVIMPLHAVQLNDTGIQFCGGAASGNNTACLTSDPSGQDAQYGRDSQSATNASTDGYAGFSFTRVSTSCVYDMVTGLTWEVKTDSNDNSFLRDKDHTYTWYTIQDGIAIGAVGDSTTCNNTLGSVTAVPCNTKNYIDKVNSTALCDYTDWRLPTRQELESIMNLGTANPTIDINYFPNTVDADNQYSKYYWSNSRHANGTDAWKIDFAYGNVYSHSYDGAYAVRLVRGTWQ
ncbi:DUF1566 domain-containing protein [Rhodoferax sp. 4810]|uniref:DUF1566 domain-containing protein n=1 Tax=Thiospirillum jenense TaxID=1653858 RepID=A0A839HBI0_9GAMM|nr:DUF1566 domain-containing protein [Thiospirillum jenense]MBB1073171.1 DUF1566 domain-containing protein [Rhodoferax jenense]MBB1124668.1 DUF1566 domain-containing protein [Thiospirillum jenense]